MKIVKLTVVTEDNQEITWEGEGFTIATTAQAKKPNQSSGRAVPYGTAIDAHLIVPIKE